jgi:hypothetical protein
MVLHFVVVGDFADFLATLNFSHLVFVIVFAAILSFAPDYVALLKTRILLKSMGDENLFGVISVLLPDVALSACISFVFAKLAAIAYAPVQHLSELSTGTLIADPIPELQRAGFADIQIYYAAFLLSTLFTSIWLALIVISSTLLKFLAPLQRFTSWFFDVEKHPLKAVGIVTGALVMLGAAIGAVVQRF